MKSNLSPNNTCLNINLNKILENYRIVKKHLKKGCKVGAVVKANAYGLGQEQIVRTLYHDGCRKFCVSNLDEALQIDQSLKKDIYLMHGVGSMEMAELAIEEGFIPILNHLEQVEIWNSASKKKGKKLKAVIQIDTGMGRFGLSNFEIKQLIADSNLVSDIEIDYIMSHMSCAEQENHPATAMQLQEFKKCLKLFPGVKATFANSAGIFLGEDFHFNMVRPGCALYGINPTSTDYNPMNSVVELHGYIIQKRIIEKEQFIGYQAQYKAAKGEKLLVIECGYADGYVRALSNKGICYAEGYFLPVVGIISMDAIIVNASALPEALFNKITHIELLGKHITIDDIAKYANTISYEILTTRFGNRCKRFYIGDNNH
ncbi:MAG: alanine racemase [Candidatus Midichloria sp.]|nr:MAG: alanine racemase [Candidatus Midichloria sp.]